jgi:hypothetical protein
MIHEFNKPIDVITDKGEKGYAIYVESSGMFFNDIWCIVLSDSGIIRHYTSKQIRIDKNSTFDININNGEH